MLHHYIEYIIRHNY